MNFAEPDRPYWEEDEDGVEHRFPLLKYFWPEQKTQAEYARLKAWHDEQVQAYANDKTKTYWPQQELLNYCM